MVSIIKNQLLKHLSRYTKNLSADKINLSTFRGEGELSNLELNEIVLTDLLELPSWLRLTSAWCNKVAFRIQWTKLKSVPIFLSLDEVSVQVETCEELRSMSMQQGLSSYSGPAKYGYINKVIDGMTVAVNKVCVTFTSPAFSASVEVCRILVESKSPTWARGDLRMTRLKESGRGQLLIFKELEWQTVRIEAKSTKDADLSPLRLLTNQARCRITIKKRISDCFILGCRLVLILDDLLWVLTDSQLKAALCFLDSLSGLVQKSTELTRTRKAARKIEELPEYQAQISQEARNKDSIPALTRIFNRYDVVETSYHFLSQKIDLHLCDDAGGGRSVHPDLKEGAALQISLQHFQVDYYPYHLAIGDRKHWPKYRESASPHSQWLTQALASFRNMFLDLIEPAHSQHTPLRHTSATSYPSLSERQPSSTKMEQQQQKRSALPSLPGNPVKNYVLKQLAKLMTTCVILRIQDFSLYQVTTSKKKQMPKEFISGDRDRYNVPEEMTTLHAEFTYYYYPGDIPFPLPPPKFYVQINPVQIRFDVLSCLWLNAFLLNLHESLLATQPQQVQTMPYVDIKIEAIMPRIIFDSAIDHPNQKDRPKSLHIQVSRASITNVRSVDNSSRADLAKCVDAFQLGSLFYGAEFPATSSDFHVVNEKFLQHLNGTDHVRPSPPHLTSTSIQDVIQKLSRELLWVEAKDVWCINLEPVWGDFIGTPAIGGNKSVTFFDAFPLTLWVFMKLPGSDNNEERIEKQEQMNKKHLSLACKNVSSSKMEESEHGKTADIHVLAYVSNLLSVQLNHYQYLFLLRLSEDVTELATLLALDSNRIHKQEAGASIVIGALVPQVEVTFVMPSQSPGKECSGGDLESVLPDSASLQEDNITASIPSLQTITKPAEEDFRQPLVQMQIEDDGGPLLEPAVNPFHSNNLKFKFMNIGNFISSIDQVLKPSPDDASDTMSLRSDASSDSEKYVMVNYEDKNTECVDAMFRITSAQSEPIQPLEVASEVVAEEEGTSTTSPSERSLDSSSRRRDLVSMSTFKLGKVEVIQQSQGFNSAIKLQVSCLTADECGSIPWDELQNKFGCRSRAWSEMPVNVDSRPQVTARLTHTVQPGEVISCASIKEWATDRLEAKVQNMNLELNMSSVVGLVDLFEDEIIPSPLPMQVSLDNLKLHLNEDRPPGNITSPGPIPIDLSLSKLSLLRGKDGVFSLEPQQTSGMEIGVSPLQTDTSMHQMAILEKSNRQLLLENRELRRRLNALERVSEENHLLRQTSEESQVLRSCLATAQDDVATLLEEKKSLLDRLKGLQDQLDQSHRSKR